MKTLFLDESGDYNPMLIDPQYPVFVLGGVIADSAYAAGLMTDALNGFKSELFGRTDIVLHTADIARKRNGFEALRDAGWRARFYRRLNDLMRGMQYSALACAIHKQPYPEFHRASYLDLYLLAFPELVQQFCYETGNAGGGVIFSERRNPNADRELQRSGERLRETGTQKVRPAEIRRRISDLRLRSKADGPAGLKIADLVVSPIGRHIPGKPDKEDWLIVRDKLRQSRSGNVAGLMVWPAIETGPTRAEASPFSR